MNRQQKRPNLFLIGAPKCGTTALYAYLQTHPQLHLPAIKEPHYFCTDFPGLRRFPSQTEYLSLFAGATTAHRYIGEATSRYLYSQMAVRNILEFAPDAKLIVMLRNPVELVHSLHNQLLYQFTETEQDFETAWRLQKDRRRGLNVPASCPCVDELMYGQVARLGSQMQRLLELVNPANLHTIFYDDFRADAHRVYRGVLEFLNLENDGRRDFPRVNGSKSFRSALIGKLIVDPPFPLSAVKSGLKQTFGWKETQVGRWLYARITVPTERKPMSDSMRTELSEYFRDDIELLSNLTGRNLDHWLPAHELTSTR